MSPTFHGDVHLAKSKEPLLTDYNAGAAWKTEATKRGPEHMELKKRPDEADSFSSQ